MVFSPVSIFTHVGRRVFSLAAAAFDVENIPPSLPSSRIFDDPGTKARA
jgi:hypothetical protein